MSGGMCRVGKNEEGYLLHTFFPYRLRVHISTEGVGGGGSGQVRKGWQEMSYRWGLGVVVHHPSAPFALPLFSIKGVWKSGKV